MNYQNFRNTYRSVLPFAEAAARMESDSSPRRRLPGTFRRRFISSTRVILLPRSRDMNYRNSFFDADR